MKLLPGPDLDTLRLVELIARILALAARLLGGNSAFFRAALPVKHIPATVMCVPGLNLVCDLSVSFTLNQSFELKNYRQLDSSWESLPLARKIH